MMKIKRQFLLASLVVMMIPQAITANPMGDSINKNPDISANLKGFGSGGRILMSDLRATYDGGLAGVGAAYTDQARVVWPNLQVRRVGMTNWTSVGSITTGSVCKGAGSGGMSSYSNKTCYSLTPSGVVIDNYTGGTMALPPRTAKLTSSTPLPWIKSKSPVKGAF